jgi:hypothetical protein
MLQDLKIRMGSWFTSPVTRKIKEQQLSGAETDTDISNNRIDADRREFSWRTVFFGFCRSRRRDARRDSEGEPVFIDWHHPWLFVLATGIMLMSGLDAFFTLQLLDRGAIEINPVMAMMIGQGTLVFATSKMMLTGVCVLALVFLSRSKFMNRIRTGLILTMFFSFYAVLICYEFVFLIQQM